MSVNNETSVTKKRGKTRMGEIFEIDEKENVRKSHATVGWLALSSLKFMAFRSCDFTFFLIC
jgi:hypothetical protein